MKQLSTVQILFGWITTVVGGAISLGILWGGITKDVAQTREQANEVKQELKGLKEAVSQVRDMVQETRERIIRIETKQDNR